MIQLDYCGYDSRHQTPPHFSYDNGLPCYLLLLVRSNAWFRINGASLMTTPNMLILIEKHTRLEYGSRDAGYNDDWVRFDFLQEEPLTQTLSLPMNQPLYLPYVEHFASYIRLLTAESHLDSPHREQICDQLIRSLLYSLHIQCRTPLSSPEARKYYAGFHRLRAEIRNAPHQKWSVAQMASSFGLSSSYFQKLYADFFGISCIRDVISARLETGKYYLSRTDMPVRAVAQLCGYENELHFMRQFKKFTGLTPTQYRKSRL